MKCTINDIANVISESIPNPAESGYDIFVGLEHYDSGEVKITRYGSTDSLVTAVKVFKKGDILLARRNVYLKRAGLVDFDGVTSGDSIVLRVKPDLSKLGTSSSSVQKYLPFVLNTEEFWNYAEKYSDGTMSKRLSPKTLLQYEFEIPDDVDNRNDLLWSAFETKESYRTMIKAIDEMVKSQFIEMFGDYHSNPKGWPVTSFEGFAKIDANMTTDYKKYADYPHIGVDSIEKGTGILSGYRTVKEDNVISGKYVFTPKHIIYSKIRPNLNKVALPDFDGVCSADAYPILPKDGICNRLYLAYLMRSNHFLEYILKFSARSSMPKVNREQINGYQAPLPPIKLQEDFSYVVGQADKSKFELKQAIEKIDKVMRYLMQ